MIFVLQLYKNIKKQRQLLGMTQTDLAKKMGYADKSNGLGKFAIR